MRFLSSFFRRKDTKDGTSEHRLGRRHYDAAQTNRHNENHWLHADSSDADTVIREALPTLRKRARYEIRNNTYAKGIVQTLANDVAGTGPRLQLQGPSATFNRAAEDSFADWAGNCDRMGRLTFGEMLRLAVTQLCESGETLIVRQQRITRHPVRLSLLMVEPDRLDSPFGLLADPTVRDGVKVDEAGLPLSYYIAKSHPGDVLNAAITEYDTIPASRVMHCYRVDRPGQTRGVPWITPALPLFAQLRRYIQAVITAAETAADLTAILKSTTDRLDPESVTSLDNVDIERNTMTTLPAGWDMQQFKPEQPAATFKEFVEQIVNQMARCFDMPYNVAAANSSGYNYASGRLDWQVYHRAVRVIEDLLEQHICNPVFYAWLAEARSIRNHLPLTMLATIRPAWYWPGTEHVDPQKEAVAQKTRLENLTTTLADEYARAGRDWERQLEQLAREKEKMDKLGLSRTAPAAPQTATETDTEADTDEEDTEDDAAA